MDEGVGVNGRVQVRVGGRDVVMIGSNQFGSGCVRGRVRCGGRGRCSGYISFAR